MPGKHSHNSMAKGMVPTYPPQLPNGREENAPVPSPFSTFVALVSQSLVGGGEDCKRDSKLFLDGIFQTGPPSENKRAF